MHTPTYSIFDCILILYTVSHKNITKFTHKIIKKKKNQPAISYNFKLSFYLHFESFLILIKGLMIVKLKFNNNQLF